MIREANSIPHDYIPLTAVWFVVFFKHVFGLAVYKAWNVYCDVRLNAINICPSFDTIPRISDVRINPMQTNVYNLMNYSQKEFFFCLQIIEIFSVFLYLRFEHILNSWYKVHSIKGKIRFMNLSLFLK